MAILGPYTGDPTKSASYLYGPHWDGLKGFNVVQGECAYNHRFGGETWKVPICENCKEMYHQIFTFDLNDPKLEEIRVDNLDELPLISCLNCSSSWGRQLFKIDAKNKKVEILSTEDTQRWIQDEESKIPVPLPEVKVKLIEMDYGDIPTDSDLYYNIYDSFGEKSICRLLGAPLYAQSPIDRECPICKGEMQYIASIGSQSYNSESVIDGVDFFIGEMDLYYFLCKKCMIIKTECQGT